MRIIAWLKKTIQASFPPLEAPSFNHKVLCEFIDKLDAVIILDVKELVLHLISVD